MQYRRNLLLSSVFSSDARALLAGPQAAKHFRALSMKRELEEATMMVEQDSFAKFIVSRNWRFSEGFWSRVIKNASTSLPAYIEGEKGTFGVTCLDEAHQAGVTGEFKSKDSRYHNRQTFAVRLGYDGNQYYGYQKQKYCPGITVEGDIYDSMGFNTIGAGRTDRGVSAISQVLCFATNDMTKSGEGLLEKFRNSAPVQDGRLAVYDCQKVPKKFHARSSATWRRYLYMFPLNRVDSAEDQLADQVGVYISKKDGAKYDVDIEYLNRVLSRLENVELPYNAFAFRHDRVTGEGLLDKCILYKAKATVVNLADIAPGVAWEPVPTPIPLNPDRKNKWQKTHHEKDVHAPADPSAGTENDVKNEGSNVDTASTAVNGEQGTTKDSAEGSAQGTAFVEDTTQKGKGGVAADGDVDDQEDEAFSLARVGRNGALPGYDKSIEVPGGAEIPAICIELVGNRFLRRMVRILTASAVREAIKPEGERNENILVEICQSNDREKAARALPGPPLALSGVGYDIPDLQIYKFMPKAEYNARMTERERNLPSKM